MKLFMIEDSFGVRPTWYFTSIYKLAKYIGVHDPAVWYAIKNKTRTQGYYVYEIEDDNIISKFINPDPETNQFRHDNTYTTNRSTVYDREID